MLLIGRRDQGDSNHGLHCAASRGVSLLNAPKFPTSRDVLQKVHELPIHLSCLVARLWSRWVRR